MDPAAELAECQKRLDRLRRPGWFGIGGGKFKLDHGDWGADFGARHDEVFRHGRAAWAAMVMANNALFVPGRRDSAAAIVYSFDPFFDSDPAVLEKAAAAVGRLKNTRPPDPVLAKVAAEVTDEASREHDLVLPPRLTFGRTVRYDTLHVQRARLPVGYLVDGLLPVVIWEQLPTQVVLMPLEAWPKSIVETWQSEARANPVAPEPPPAPASAEDYLNNPVTLSESAAAEVRKIMAEQGLVNGVLLVGWDEGAYKLDITEEWTDPRTHFATESQRICVVVDHASASRLMGMQVDYRRDSRVEGFRFNERRA